ncbi:SDR family oxidoreductase [Actinopolyspora mortivallis]|uniref:3-oxoacyl-ACP reductase n=1 Tax=Actinopolyspora mortivallis TaxID=33906 RepID=A0A2T0GUR9_ACTMO|nr:SDR family oxidoreductase [Actinopolyspora mortivallis]PRW62866.1 3-oxoacyl-ACP reductase [Actinopolyspora mortivallis]
MTGRFTDKAALVVGGSRGIGYATAEQLAREGGNVAITGRDESTLEQAARTIGERTGAKVLALTGHARKAEQRESTVDRAVAEFGRLDVLVHNTATNVSKNAPVLDLDPEVMLKEYDLNVISALEYVKLAHRASMEEHGGTVVLLSSVAGSANIRVPAYSMTKAALESLCRSLADQLAPGVRVNSVAPAFVDTEFATYLQRIPRERIDSSYPLGRESAPEDVARAIAFLASDEAKLITGTTLVVDGGKSVQPYRHDIPHPEVGQVLH